jgi:hypothetical protein
MPFILFPILGFMAGFGVAWYFLSIWLRNLKRTLQETTGFLEREKLGKERLQREMEQSYQREAELNRKYEKAMQVCREMDADILLLQKANEETESLLKSTEPEVYALKLKLIEANNTIARMKGKIE